MLPGLLKPPGFMAPQGVAPLPRMIASGTGGISTSDDDGATWTNRVSLAVNMRDIAWSGTAAICIGPGGRVYRSVDGGLNWSLATIRNASSSWQYAMYGEGRFIITGFEGGTTFLYYSDDDGASWSAGTHPMPGNAISRGGYANGVFFLGGSNSSNALHLSLDKGASWTSFARVGGMTFCNGAAYGNGRFVVVGHNGSSGTAAYLTGTSGTLTNISLSGVSPMNCVRFLNGEFIGGHGSSNWFSGDGTALANGGALGQANATSDVAYRNGRWVFGYGANTSTNRRNTTAGDKSAWSAITIHNWVMCVVG